jgi:RimJ/RimL family protein N-acetyltransferase
VTGPAAAGPSSAGLSPAYPLRTERLVLRPWRPDEIDTYHRLRGDPEVVRYLYDEPLARDVAEAKLASLSSSIAAPGDWINVAVDAAATGEVAGDVGIGWISEVHQQVELGYTFFAAHRGQGYATEASAAMVGLAFTGLGAHRVSARLDARNTASAGVLERLGFRREADFVENEWVKGEWTDEAVYGILASEWAVHHPPSES